MDNSITQKFIDASPAIQTALEILKKEVYRLTKGEDEAKKLLSDLLGLEDSRPKHWSPNSNAAYYKEKYGKLLLKWLDKLEANPSKDFLLNTSKIAKSRESILNQISQSWQWLIDNASNQEEANKLVAMRAHLVVRKVPEGVIIMHRKELNLEDLLKGHLIPKQVDKTSKWKEELTEFVEKAEDGKMLDIENLRLEPYDIDWVKNLIDNAQGIFPKKLGATRIMLIKHMELWKKMRDMDK